MNCVKIDQLTGCTPFTINVQYCGIGDTLLNGFNQIYDYNESGNLTSNTFFTYREPGLFDLKQIIAINNSQFNDAFSKTYFDTIRAVSTPEISIKLTPCSAKQLLIEVDSSSYDFYVITNDLNSDQDTILESGSLIKDFLGTAAREVQVSAMGQYFQADCNRMVSAKAVLLEQMTPQNITELSEFQTPSIEFEPSGPFFYQLDLNESGLLVDSQLWDQSVIIQNYQTPIAPYTDLTFLARDRCQNQEVIFQTESFGTTTVFENNQNTTSLTPTSFMPGSFDFIKYQNESFGPVAAVDQQIVCNQTTCYGALTTQTLNGYTFRHFASGDCGTSFSNDLPIHPSTYSIDHSPQNQTRILLDPQLDIRAYRLNGTTAELNGSRLIETPKSNDCLEFSFQNSCLVWSTDTTLCPLVLDYSNFILSWNASPNSGYHLVWGLSDLPDTLITRVQSGDLLEPSSYPAQEFCIALIDTVTSSLSNKICLSSEPLFFVPDLAQRGERLKVKTRYVTQYSMELLDLNGNLVRQLDPNNLSLDNLAPDSYFYILRYETESGEELKTNGSIIIK